jgi:hypothetical protein
MSRFSLFFLLVVTELSHYFALNIALLLKATKLDHSKYSNRRIFLFWLGYAAAAG